MTNFLKPFILTYFTKSESAKCSRFGRDLQRYPVQTSTDKQDFLFCGRPAAPLLQRLLSCTPVFETAPTPLSQLPGGLPRLPVFGDLFALIPLRCHLVIRWAQRELAGLKWQHSLAWISCTPFHCPSGAPAPSPALFQTLHANHLSPLHFQTWPKASGPYCSVNLDPQQPHLLNTLQKPVCCPEYLIGL